MYITISKIKKWEKSHNIGKLIEALHTEDDDLRQAICLILGKFNSSEAFAALSYIEKNDANEFVKIEAKKSISHIISQIDFSIQHNSIQDDNLLGFLPIHV